MFIFPLVLGFIILIGTTIGLLRMMKKRQQPKWVSGVILVAFAALSFALVKGVYRPYGLYKMYFAKAVGMPFPKAGDYIFADTFIEGEETKSFSSVAVVKLNSEDMAALRQQLSEKNFVVVNDTIIKNSGVKDRLNYVLSFSDAKSEVSNLGFVFTEEVMDKGKIYTVETLKYYFGFLDDEESVFIYLAGE